MLQWIGVERYKNNVEWETYNEKFSCLNLFLNNWLLLRKLVIILIFIFYLKK